MTHPPNDDLDRVPDDPARRPESHPDPAEPAHEERDEKGRIRSHTEKEPLRTGRTERRLNPRTWPSGWDLRQWSVGMAVVWLIVLILLAGLILEYAAGGLIRLWFGGA